MRTTKKKPKIWSHCEEDDVTCPVCGYQLCDQESIALGLADEYDCPGCKTRNTIVGHTTLEVLTVQTSKSFEAGKKVPDPEWTR